MIVCAMRTACTEDWRFLTYVLRVLQDDAATISFLLLLVCLWCLSVDLPHNVVEDLVDVDFSFG